MSANMETSALSIALLLIGPGHAPGPNPHGQVDLNPPLQNIVPAEVRDGVLRPLLLMLKLVLLLR